MSQVTDLQLHRALLALAKHNVAPDIQGMLISGNDRNDIKPGALKSAIMAAINQNDSDVEEPLKQNPTAWHHEITEPDGQKHSMLSFSAENPWAHWMEEYKVQCKYRSRALVYILSSSGWSFDIGDIVHKPTGSWWEGEVVGFYSTKNTPEGYCVQLEKENGPVQIYPVTALKIGVSES